MNLVYSQLVKARNAQRTRLVVEEGETRREFENVECCGSYFSPEVK